MLSGLYGITSDYFLSQTENKIIEGIEASCSAGLSILQYRQKNSPQIPLATLKTIQAICKQYRTTFIINDNLELAIKLKADGVHLGKDDHHIMTAQKETDASFIVGASCYNSILLAQQAQANGASYVAFGAMFPSSTKPNAPLAEIHTLTQAKKELTIPICAIGGINAENIATVSKQKIDMFAVVSEIFNQTDIYNATATLIAAANKP